MQKYLHLLEEARAVSRNYLLKINKENINQSVQQLRSIIQRSGISRKENYKEIESDTYKLLRQDYVSIDAINKIRDIILHDFEADLIQSSFTVRVQLPSFRSVPFHIDLWSGHPKTTINIWFSLTNLDDGNCLYSVDPVNTDTLLKRFRLGELSLTELDREASLLAQPLVDNQSQNTIFVFSNDFLHGNKINTSTTRISIDFRISFLDGFSGPKIIGHDYRFYARKIAKNQVKFDYKRVAVLIFQNNDAKYLSHQTQRDILYSFIDNNNLTIWETGSEFHDFDNFPQMTQWLQKGEFILVVSSRIFCRNGTILPYVRDLSKINKSRIFCVLEEEFLNILWPETPHEI